MTLDLTVLKGSCFKIFSFHIQSYFVHFTVYIQSLFLNLALNIYVIYIVL